MIKKSTYVRCSIDVEYPTEPRDFALAKVIDIDEFAEIVNLEFMDLYGIRQYYAITETIKMPLSKVTHCRINIGAMVEYSSKIYYVKSCVLNKDEEIFYYYIYSYETEELVYVPETQIKASFCDSYISPLKQMTSFEFQNPTWYFGRSNVNETLRLIQNSVYGFEKLTGCKIQLMPHQLKTVMRCLADDRCRYMIADEVGTGKTIEAASIVKIYISDKCNKKIAFILPDALVEQWRTELAFKFRIFEGRNCNDNIIDLIPASKLYSVVESKYDFVIIDEVHRMIDSGVLYNKVLSISKAVDNILMLSATPIQSRKEEYHKLLTLIQPDKYENMSDEEFDRINSLHNSIMMDIHGVYSNLEEMRIELDENDNELSRDIEDLFEDISDNLEDIGDRIDDLRVSQIIKEADINSEDRGIQTFEKVIAYICETYQLEKSVIKNRRMFVTPSIEFKREIIDLSYSLEDDCNSTEYALNVRLSDWLGNIEKSPTDFKNTYKFIICSFFSSAAAFCTSLRSAIVDIPDDILELAEKFSREEKNVVNNIGDVLADPSDKYNRLVKIIDYIDQELFDKKVILFTDYTDTFELYKMALLSHFGEDSCCFFSTKMKSDELELNTYRFQTDESYTIMLSDKSGGEGRNFQNADAVIHIDIPWSANDLEQRIGRLGRVGRDIDKPVLSIVAYAENTLENDLFCFWNNGLKVFTKTQSGLEIIMNEIDGKIIEAVNSDYDKGLRDIVPEIIASVEKLEESVKRERNFDVAQFKYNVLNRQIENTLGKYNLRETELFLSSMRGWANLAGFKGNWVNEEHTIYRYTASSFSSKSAYNTFFVPPDMKKLIDDNMNQMQNRVRSMNGKSKAQTDISYIQGTFDRSIALKSDYIHFFAPGDEIYDSIVNNSLNSYKGKCSAIALNGPINWEGFVFSWVIAPDELVLLKNNVSVRKIEQYRQFIDCDVVQTVCTISEDANENNSIIVEAFKQLKGIPLAVLKDEVEHLGQRRVKKRFLGIENTNSISNIEMFKKVHPQEKWERIVKHCYEKSKSSMSTILKTKIKEKDLRDTIQVHKSENAVSALYYGEHSNASNEADYEYITASIIKPKIVLDSVCYVRMIKL